MPNKDGDGHMRDLPQNGDGEDCEGLEVPTYFVRHRNFLLAKADFGELFVDYYLHLNDHGMRPGDEEDNLLKAALALVTLHSASRPWNETIAWTINFQHPLLNIFVTGDNGTGSVVGRSYTEGVLARERGIFYADTLRDGVANRRSAVEFDGRTMPEALAAYYAGSEQRPARLFTLGPEEFVLLVGQPDADLEWLAGLDNEQVASIEHTEDLGPLERRRYRWRCGCDQARILRVIMPLFAKEPDALFEGDAVLKIQCPRCGSRHRITREAAEAALASGQ